MRKQCICTAAKIGFGVMVLLAQCHTMQAAEIKVLSITVFKKPLDVLGPQFEQATGHKLVIKYAGSTDVTRLVEAGETFDAALVWPGMIDRLIKEGKVAAGSRTDIARAATAVAVKKGAAKPDISTTDAFKRAMLNAKSVSFSADGESGIYFKSLLERLGMADEMKPKLRPVPGGPLVVGPVVKGEVELAVISVQFILNEPGAELVGPLPAELRHFTIYTAGVSATSGQKEAASALIRNITSPAAAPLIKSVGLDPVVP